MTNESRPAGAASVTDWSSQIVPAKTPLRHELDRILARVDWAEPVRRRVVQDALSAALACTWRRRAATLEWARPRPGEFAGRATADELAERDRRLAAQATACRHHAELLELGLLDFEVA